jgi:hypothetical protein
VAGKENAGEKNGMVAYSYTVTGTSPTGVQQ